MQVSAVVSASGGGKSPELGANKRNSAVITIREVAKESGFSSTTVSIVLNNAPLALKLRNYIPTTIESQRKPTVNKIREWLQTICTKCGYSIAPIDLVRLDNERVRCPECGKDFVPVAKSTGRKELL